MKTRSRQTHNLKIPPSRWLAYSGAAAAPRQLDPVPPMEKSIILGGVTSFFRATKVRALHFRSTKPAIPLLSYIPSHFGHRARPFSA